MHMARMLMHSADEGIGLLPWTDYQRHSEHDAILGNEEGVSVDSMNM